MGTYTGMVTVTSASAGNSPQADSSIKPLPYDVDAAKKLLAEAGYSDPDNSGVLKGPGLTRRVPSGKVPSRRWM